MRWASPEDFNEMRIMPRMLLDHLPENVLKTIDAVLDCQQTEIGLDVAEITIIWNAEEKCARISCLLKWISIFIRHFYRRSIMCKMLSTVESVRFVVLEWRIIFIIVVFVVIATFNVFFFLELFIYYCLLICS